MVSLLSKSGEKEAYVRPEDYSSEDIGRINAQLANERDRLSNEARKEVINRIVKLNFDLVPFLAHRYSSPDEITFDEAMDLAVDALMYCAEKWNPDRCNHFSGFMNLYMSTKSISLKKWKSVRSRAEFHYIQSRNKGQTLPVEVDGDVQRAVRKGLENLPTHEREILEAMVRLDCLDKGRIKHGRGSNLARIVGESDSAIKKRKCRILKKLREIPEIRKARDLLSESSEGYCPESEQ